LLDNQTFAGRNREAGALVCLARGEMHEVEVLFERLKSGVVLRPDRDGVRVPGSNPGAARPRKTPARRRSSSAASS
jgi:hypothetical protein